VRVLNLYAGIGGNRALWDSCKITAVESADKIHDVYSDLWPDDSVVLGDAHQYLIENSAEFEFIWSSPPCQSHSKMVKAGRNRTPRYPDLALYEEIIFLQHFCKVPWVVENVVPYYDYLIPPTAVIGRHAFWSNMDLTFIQDVPRPAGFINKQNQQAKKELLSWLGLPDIPNLYCGQNHDPTQVIRNCVHPEIGRQILEVARKWLN